MQQKVMPSMRLLQYAGEVIDKNEISAYNCSFIKVDSISAITEIMFVNMSGVGVGYSVEKINADRLPLIQPLQAKLKYVHIVFDSTKG